MDRAPRRDRRPIVAVLAAIAFGLLWAQPALADHEIERIEGPGWALTGADGSALGGTLEIKAGDGTFTARIAEPPPNECFVGGTTLYELSGHEPEYKGTEYYALVAEKTDPDRVEELRADEELDEAYQCTGAFEGHEAKLTVSTVGEQKLRFGGGATDDFLPMLWELPRKDTDGDGLLDDEEISGINIPYDPQTRALSPETEVDLRRMGADPERKDLFLEVDQMAGHVLTKDAVMHVARTFDRAPVTNPDGSTGISLHIDAGPGSLMDQATGRTWGELSRSDSIPFDRSTGSLTADGDYVWSEYEGLKAKFFDDCPPGGGFCNSARSLAFRYMVTIHDLPGEDRAGESRGIPGVDSVTALQCPGVRTLCNLDWFDQAAMLMHELGHNLGLGHGGPGDDTNFKPNHFSVMNYSYAYGIPFTSGVALALSPLDGSDVPALNERSLLESRGVRAPALAVGRLISIFRCDPGNRLRRVVTSRPADFDCDGSTQGTVAADINHDGARGILRTANEYEALVLDPRFITDTPFPTTAAARWRAQPATTASVEEPGRSETRALIHGDRRKPKLRIKKRRRGGSVVLKIRARDKKELDRLIVELKKPVSDYVEKQPKGKRRPVSFKVRVPKRTKVGVVALDRAGNVRERRFRAG